MAAACGKSGRSDTAGDRQGYDWNLVYGSVKRMNTSIVTHSGRKETRKKEQQVPEGTLRIAMVSYQLFLVWMLRHSDDEPGPTRKQWIQL